MFVGHWSYPTSNVVSLSTEIANVECGAGVYLTHDDKFGVWMRIYSVVLDVFFIFNFGHT